MYTIKVLRNFTIDFPVPGLAMYFQNKIDQTVEVCGYIWLLRGEGKTIVVDAGIGKAPVNEKAEKQMVMHFTVAPHEDTASLLKREDIDPSDVDILILTHLHLDHCLNAPLFTRAKILISRVGWGSILHPAHPRMTPDPLFPESVFRYLREQAWDRVELLEREQEILPGMTVFHTGGHTPCSQAVLVETAKGKAALAGDVISLYGHVEENIPVAYCCNLAECYQAMDDIRNRADIILPNHDPEVLQRHPGGQIG